MARFKRNYLPSQSRPWAKQLEDAIDSTERSFKTLDVNNRSKDEQFSASLNRLDGAVIEARSASELADAAQNAAIAANTLATTANGNAIAANSLATTANSTAIAANSTAISANTTATTANSTASTANTNALNAIADVVGLSSSGGTSINADNISGGTITGVSVSVSGGYIEAPFGTVFGSTVTGGDWLYADGRFNSIGTYNATVSSAANLFISSNGNVARSTSSLRYKTDVQDLDLGMMALELQPRTWIDKREYEENGNSAEGLTRFPGFIAEELHDLGFNSLVIYNEQGQPEAISYDRMTVAIIPVLKQQQTLIEQLTARIEALESN